MELTKRLMCTASKIRISSFPADIGTDHAYIPIYLTKDGTCSKVIATDVKIGPLKRAEKNIRKYNLQDRIQVRQGSGLSPLESGEVDCVILAGMGGHLICDILKNGKKKAENIKYFVFQPMQVPEVVREYLYKNDYTIYDEQLVKEDGKIFQVFAAEHGIDKIDDEIYFEISKILIKNRDPLIIEFIEGKIHEISMVIEKIKSIESNNAKVRLMECTMKLSKYQEVLKCL